MNGSVGGEDNLVQLEIEQLSSLGYEVIDGRTIDFGVKRKLNQLRAQTFGSHADILSMLDKTNPHVIHTHNLSQRSGYRWMTQTRIPIVSSIHNYRLFCASSIAWRNGQNCFDCRDKSARSAIRNHCDGVRGSLNATRQLLIQPSQPQIHVPKLFLTGSNMMNQALSPIIPLEKMRILRNPGLGEKIVQSHQSSRSGWLFAGRFVEEKGILELIESWPPGEILDLAGSGPLLERVLGMIQIRPNIRVIGTFPPGTLDIYYKYEGLIFPSTWLEGSPLVIADAMSAGTPTIALRKSAASEQVDLSGAGVVIDAELNESTLGKAIQDVRLRFEEYSRSAIMASKSTFSIKNWTLDLSRYLSEAASL